MRLLKRSMLQQRKADICLTQLRDLPDAASLCRNMSVHSMSYLLRNRRLQHECFPLPVSFSVRSCSAL